MRQSEQIDKVSAALVAARSKMRPVGKSGDNKFDKYRYAKLEDYIEATDSDIIANGLSVLTEVVGVETMETRPTKNGGNEYPVRVKLAVRLLHTSGQWIECDAFGEGQDRGDKGLYKAITGGRKYALACVFGLSTTDDPEATEGHDAAPPPAQRATPPKPPMSPVKTQLKNTVQTWGSLKPEQIGAAVKACAAKAGVTVPKEGMNDDDAGKVLAWVMEMCGKDAVMAEVIA